MMTNSPIEIDMLEFFKSGKFDCLELGRSKDWVLSNFADPDSVWDEDMQAGGFDIWTYGNIEMHFEKGKLFLIFSDNFEDFSGGQDLRLKRWIFDDVDKLDLTFVLKALNNAEIDFKKQSDDLGVLLRLSSGVELTFENVADQEHLSQNAFHLTSFGLVAENPRRWKV